MKIVTLPLTIEAGHKIVIENTSDEHIIIQAPEFNYIFNKWISVKDKLPKVDEIVLIYTPKDKVITSACINPIEYRGTFWFYPENNGWNEDEVTHWMPLPEPPND